MRAIPTGMTKLRGPRGPDWQKMTETAPNAANTPKRVCPNTCTGHTVHSIQVIGSPGRLIHHGMTLKHIEANRFWLNGAGGSQQVWAYNYPAILARLAVGDGPKITYRPNSRVLAINSEDGSSFSCYNLAFEPIDPCFG
jgi:hypothetical protein